MSLLTLLFGNAFAEQAPTPQVFYNCQPNASKIITPAPSLFRDPEGSEIDFLFPKQRECQLWLHFQIHLEKKQDYALQIHYPTLDWAQPWIDGVPMDPQGGSLPIAQRKRPTHLPSWTFTLDSGSHHIDLLVLDATGQRRVPITLEPEAKWVQSLEQQSFLDGILIGLLLFNMLGAIILAIIIGRDLIGWLYAIYVFFTTAYLLVASGHAFAVLWPKHPEINAFIQMLSALSATSLVVLWALRFQEATRFLPRWSKFNNILAVILAIAACMLPLSLNASAAHYIQWFRQQGVLDVLSVCLLVSALLETLWLAWKKNQRESLLLLISLISPMIAMLLSYSHDLGLLQMTMPTRVLLLQVAAILMFTVLSMSLARRLHLRLKESAALEHRYSTTVVQAADRERERIARELHDDIGQRLVALQYQLYNDDSPGLAAQIREILKDLRQLAHGLHPALLINGHLGDALEIWARDLEAKGICKMHIQLDARTHAIQGEYALHLLRIFQECTSNGLRHGHATEFTIAGVLNQTQFEVHVSNNGEPIPHDNVEGMGFTSIRARLRLMGGKLEIIPWKPESSGPVLQMNIPN